MHNDSNRREQQGRFHFGSRERERDFDRHQAGGMGHDGYRPIERSEEDTDDAFQEGEVRAEPVRRAAQGNMANLSLEARSGRAQQGREIMSAEQVLRSFPSEKQPFRAPKGYKRSDERIREEVWRELCERQQVELDGLEIVVNQARVTLKGHVPTRAMKYLVEQLADNVAGVEEVDNELRVG